MFSWSRSNALLALAEAGLPSVDETVVDAKADLEDALKRACTRFIASATQASAHQRQTPGLSLESIRSYSQTLTPYSLLGGGW